MIYIIGIDLSGPSNIKDTALVSLEVSRKGPLTFHKSVIGASDQDILNFIKGLPLNGEVIIGLDAPLSYNPGGGDRPSDKSLRKEIVSLGLKSGSVMTPTMTRMVYLTLRGISLARAILIEQGDRCRIVEVHPGATLALHGAPIRDVLSFKKDPKSCMKLLNWMTMQGLKGIEKAADPGDHYVACCASALAAWKWHRNESKWIWPANPPIHPFDYAC